MRLTYSNRLVAYISAFVITVLLVVLHVAGILSPVESVIAETPRPIVFVLRGTTRSVKTFFSYFGSVHKLSKDNARLVEQVRNLQKDNITLQQYQLENEKLRRELDFRSTSPLSFISANVISKDPTGLRQSYVISAGSQDGVKVGAAVLSQGVFIGKIASVDTFTSEVLLITDPQSSIDAQISSTGDNGIVRGNYGSGIVLDMISQNAKINKGDEVVTFGLTAQVPKGLLIGTVGELQSQKNDILQKSTLLPSVDLKDLNFVSVVK
jgi:rod shape-determining protein MreC